MLGGFDWRSYDRSSRRLFAQELELPSHAWIVIPSLSVHQKVKDVMIRVHVHVNKIFQKRILWKLAEGKQKQISLPEKTGDNIIVFILV